MPRMGNVVGGKYVLEESIGEGAMGSVWKAVHQTLGRPFAVKFLKAYGLEVDRLEDRFLQEARLAASIQHRFVVSLLDFGLTDEGMPYMVMEFLHGESLARRLTHAPPLSARELLRIMAQALVGLEAVHQAGVIHRDLKPENIMLIHEAGGVIPKLVDFGISRVERRISRGGQKLTSPGTALGTPCYMAPEQVCADQRVDRRGDIYSMGVILYEALAGRLPYEADDLLTLLEKVVRGGAAPLDQVRPELGLALSAIVERAMEVDRERRFPQAGDMAAVLFSAATQVPEAVVCPVRRGDAHRAPTAELGAPLRPIIPPEAEVADEVLARPPAISTTKVRLRRSHLPLAFVGAGAAAVVLVAVLAALRTPPAATAPLAPVASRAAAAPVVVPVPAPPAAAPAEPPATPRARVRDRAVKRTRLMAKTPERRGGGNPPEAFTDPGF